MALARHTVIVSGETALRAIRRERRISSRLSWIPVGPDEQRRALASATCLADLIDLEGFRRLGILEDGETLDVVIHPHSKFQISEQIHPHKRSELGQNGLLKIYRDTYAMAPARLVIDLAPKLSLAQQLALIEELTGSWSLPERALNLKELAESIDFIDKPCGYYESDPVLDVAQLKEYWRQSEGLRGRKVSERAVAYATGNSRSPMEAIMNCMFALPHSLGGLNCGPIRANHKIVMDASARALSGLPHAVADAYLPALDSILEYNGSYHDETSIRRRDEARTLGLMSMGIDVYRINNEQLRDANCLESIAETIRRRHGKQFRPRCKGYPANLHRLLAELRKAVGLDQADALNRRRDEA